MLFLLVGCFLAFPNIHIYNGCPFVTVSLLLYIYIYIYYIGNEVYIYIKRRHQKSDPKVCRKHTRTAKRHNQEKEGLKEHEPPQRVPNQSKKLTRDKGSSSIKILVHDHKIQTKEFFTLWIKNSSFSKVIIFFSFQTV